MNHHSTYYGVSIYRNTEPGYRLRWTTGQMPNTNRLAANTLAGIRDLIRQHVKRHAK